LSFLRKSNIKNQSGKKFAVVSQTFHCCDKIPMTTENGKMYLGSQLQRFQSVVSWFYCVWAIVSRAHDKGVWRSKVAHSMVASKQRETERGWGPSMSFFDMSP
jgi:hypothetical protein